EAVCVQRWVSLVRGGGADVETRVTQSLGDHRVDPVRIHRGHRRIVALLAVLRPNRDARHDAAGTSDGAGPDAGTRSSGTALPSVTTAPSFCADKRIASHRRAIGSPTSAEFGWGASPARTWTKRCHTDPGVSAGIRRKRWWPSRWSSSSSPYIPVRRIALVVKNR